MQSKFKNQNRLVGLVSVAVFLTVWEIVGRFEVIDSLFVSYPSKVFQDGFYLFETGKIWPHLAISLKTIFFGFSLASIAGSVAGILIGSSRRLYDIFNPYIYFINAFPKIALIPLIIIWFGIGISSKIAIVFLMSISSITISVIDGTRRVDPDLLKMAKNFQLKKIEMLIKIFLPNSLPFIFSGMRIATGRAVIGLVVGEVFGYGKGLGYLLSFYGSNFQTSRLMFIIFLFLTINLSMVGLISILERKLVKWKT